MNVILKALMVSVWFMALTFPLVVMKVDALNDTILFRWENMATIGVVRALHLLALEHGTQGPRRGFHRPVAVRPHA